jgi:hypothetical protein
MERLLSQMSRRYLVYSGFQHAFYLLTFVKTNSGGSNNLAVTIDWWNLGTAAASTNDISRAPDRTRTVNLTGVSDVFDSLKFKVDGWVNIDDLRVGPTRVSVTGFQPVASDGWVEEATETQVVLRWMAPVDPRGNYRIDPDLVNQYVFMSDGDPDAEPNLIYLGATGDPGIADPNSRYPSVGTIPVQYNRLYHWVVVGRTLSKT